MIRPARFSDLHQIRYLGYAALGPFQHRMGRKPAPLSADFRELVRLGRIHVYMIENAVRGFICFHIDGPDVHIETIAVAPKFRGRGIGRSLLDLADKMGLKEGCRRVVLYTNVLMFENVAYYRGKGFQEIDTRAHKDHERVYFERYLR